MQIIGYMGILAIIGLTLFYFVLYHKIFVVFYTSIFDGILKELFACFFLAICTVALLKNVLAAIISVIARVIAFIFGIIILLLKVAAVLLLVGGVGYLVYRFARRVIGTGRKFEATQKMEESDIQEEAENI